MAFMRIKELLEGVKNGLEDMPDTPLKDVRTIALTGYENLLKAVTDLAIFPCALICAGVVEGDDDGATRTAEVAILLGDEFRLDAEDAAHGYDLIDDMLDYLTGDDPGQAFKICGAWLTDPAVEPLDIESSHCWWKIVMTAHYAC